MRIRRYTFVGDRAYFALLLRFLDDLGVSWYSLPGWDLAAVGTFGTQPRVWWMHDLPPPPRFS